MLGFMCEFEKLAEKFAFQNSGVFGVVLAPFRGLARALHASARVPHAAARSVQVAPTQGACGALWARVQIVAAVAGRPVPRGGAVRGGVRSMLARPCASRLATRALRLFSPSIWAWCRACAGKFSSSVDLLSRVERFSVGMRDLSDILTRTDMNVLCMACGAQMCESSAPQVVRARAIRFGVS